MSDGYRYIPGAYGPHGPFPQAEGGYFPDLPEALPNSSAAVLEEIAVRVVRKVDEVSRKSGKSRKATLAALARGEYGEAWKKHIETIKLEAPHLLTLAGQLGVAVGQVRALSNSGSRMLYHIGKRRPYPVPYKHDPERGWKREGRNLKGKKAVFLTPHPIWTSQVHGVSGNVYAFEVPYSVIRASGGIRVYDWGPELVITEDNWDKVKFVGKVMSRRDLEQEVRKAMTLHAASDWMGKNVRDPDALKVIEKGRERAIRQRRLELDTLQAASREMSPEDFKAWRKQQRKEFRLTRSWGFSSKTNPSRKNPTRKIDGITVEPYDKARDQINAQRRAIYEDKLKRLLGINYKQPFRSPHGVRLDSALWWTGQQAFVREAHRFAFAAGTAVQQKTGWLKRGSQDITKRTRERSKERHEEKSEAERLLDKQNYEEMLAIVRENYYRVLTYAGKAYIWPMPPGQKRPKAMTVDAAVKQAKFLSERRDPRNTGRWWTP